MPVTGPSAMSTRTSPPTVAECSRWARRRSSRPSGASRSVRRASNRARTVFNSSARSILWPAAASDVAPGGASSLRAGQPTLTPMPTTIATDPAPGVPSGRPPDPPGDDPAPQGPSGTGPSGTGPPPAGPPPAGLPATSSARMPATLPGAVPSTSSTSLGHFTAASTPRVARASTVATARVVVTSGWRSGFQVGRSRTEKSRLVAGGASQRRSRRPRPVVWWSATSTEPSDATTAPATRSALVEPVTVTCRTDPNRVPPGARNGRLPGGLCETGAIRVTIRPCSTRF